MTTYLNVSIINVYKGFPLLSPPPFLNPKTLICNSSPAFSIFSVTSKSSEIGVGSPEE